MNIGLVVFLCLLGGFGLGSLATWLEVRRKRPLRYCEDCVHRSPGSPWDRCLAVVKAYSGEKYVTRDAECRNHEWCRDQNNGGRCRYWEPKSGTEGEA